MLPRFKLIGILLTWVLKQNDQIIIWNWSYVDSFQLPFSCNIRQNSFVSLQRRERQNYYLNQYTNSYLTTNRHRRSLTGMTLQAESSTTSSSNATTSAVAALVTDVTIPVQGTPIVNDGDELSTDKVMLLESIQQQQQYTIMGVPITIELIVIMTIYFVEGALGLVRLAQSYLLKDTLHLGPSELSAISGFFILPWTIKPIYGFLSDSFPLFNYQRKSYLILCGLLGALSYGVLSYEPFWESISLSMSTQGTVLALLLGSACIAFSDVVADGIVVSRTREMATIEQERQQLEFGQNTNNTIIEQTEPSASAGGLQSLCWGASAIGGLISAYYSGSLLEVMSVRDIFGITALLPLLVAFIALFVPEEPVKKSPIDDENKTISLMNGIQDQISTLWGAFQQSSIWRPTLFIFLWQSTPTSDGAFFYYLTNELQFGPEFLGRVRFITALAGLIGVVLYNQYFKYMPIKNILYWSTLISFPLGLLPVLLITHLNREMGIPDTWLIYGDDVALAVLGTIAFMPTLVLAAQLCPKGIEAVLFATLMSIYNGASTVGTELGALLTKFAGITETNFDNLALLTILCNVSSLWPLLLIGWLDEVGSISEADIEASTTRTIDVQHVSSLNKDTR